MSLLVKFVTPLFFALSVLGCHPDEHPGKDLSIHNNSNDRIYYWYSTEYDTQHYPDTLLPQEIPIYFNSIAAHNTGGASGYDPDWESIYSQLPEGKFSVYFFDNAPTQEEWKEIRENYAILARKDVTFQELKKNDYIISYP